MIKTVSLFLLAQLFIIFPLNALITREEQRSPSPAALTEEMRQSLPAKQTHKGPLVYSGNRPAHPSIDFYRRQFLEPESLEWVQRALDRGRPYLNYISARAIEHEIPIEVIFLPVLESAFYPFAVSRANAVGMWQFIASSGIPYGIKIDEWLDERRDFWKITEAAMKKLRYNYSILGDWFLALAAYNCGLGRVTRTIAQSGIDDFWTLRDLGLLPAETRAYVPKFLALLEISMYPGRNGLEIHWDRGIEWTRIPVSTVIDLRYLAREAELDYELLRWGNAELHYHITPPHGERYFLKVPAKEADKVIETLNNEKIRLMKVYVHTIKEGDTLSHLAAHFGVSVTMIQQYNPGLRPKALGIGMKVIVPHIKDVGPYTGKTEKPTVNRLPTGQGKTYTVQSGDTLWDISMKFGSSPDYIAAANNISVHTTIQIGQVLLIPHELVKEGIESGL